MREKDRKVKPRHRRRGGDGLSLPTTGGECKTATEGRKDETDGRRDAPCPPLWGQGQRPADRSTNTVKLLSGPEKELKVDAMISSKPRPRPGAFGLSYICCCFFYVHQSIIHSHGKRVVNRPAGRRPPRPPVPAPSVDIASPVRRSRCWTGTSAASP